MLFLVALTASNQPELKRRRLRLGSVAGITTPVLFVAVFLVEGWLRPGYQPLSMFVSELSLGPRGGCRSSTSWSPAPRWSCSAMQ